MFEIRRFEASDWAGTWAALQPVFRAGETYPFAPDIHEGEAHRVWVKHPRSTFVALDDRGRIAGTYYIKPNQAALGAHVCNCGYVVADFARRQGLGAALCRHSQAQALDEGYRAMQFNLVVSTNTAAVRLWQRCGMEIVARLPGAFRLPSGDFVDAFVMYRWLGEG
ncbi:MAG: GNAT family N-acetyltransferase [Myxococcales bacterium]|nr:GNAT family N-acetyltransferase [Myxococcales bacterium]